MQTSYTSRHAVAVEGMIADSRLVKHVNSRISVGTIKAGKGVFRASAWEPAQTDGDRHNPGTVAQTLSPAAAADVDAIATGTVIKSSASIAAYTAAQADGVIGAGTLYPPRKLTITFDASTDWDPTNGTISFLDENGDLTTETLVITTSTTRTTVKRARSFVSWSQPAQTGAGGTATIGIAALAYTLADFEGVAVYDSSIERQADAIAAGVEWGDKVVLPVLAIGAIYVFPEVAVTPADAVYVRIASGAGGTVLGAFRTDADTASAVLVTGAKWRTKSAAGAPAVLVLPA